MARQSKKSILPSNYVVPVPRLNYFEPKEPDNFTGMAHKDSTFPIPIDWIAANASRFYFTNAQIIAAGKPELILPDTGYCRAYVIYFLIKGSEIIYVGQSADPERRMEQHRKNGLHFDLVTWFEAPSIFLNDIEAFYIWRCNPIMNNKWPNYAHFGEAAKALDEQHGEKRNDAVYVDVIRPYR